MNLENNLQEFLQVRDRYELLKRAAGQVGNSIYFTSISGYTTKEYYALQRELMSMYLSFNLTEVVLVQMMSSGGPGGDYDHRWCFKVLTDNSGALLCFDGSTPYYLSNSEVIKKLEYYQEKEPLRCKGEVNILMKLMEKSKKSVSE